MSLSPGTRLGAYEVGSKLGAGGMGEVWRAHHARLGRDVALKILPDAFAADPDRLARFEREAKVLASLNHPNIAAIYGVEESGDTKALVLELVEGPTLADRIAQGPIPVDEALAIATQIADALEAAHQQGVIHRDLKPANIKLRSDGTVKVLDFGLAKALQPDVADASASMSPTISLTAAATQVGTVIGTAAYVSPEQASGKPVDRRADVWAFGVVLYEMLTGRRPFAADDVAKTLARVIAIDPDWSVLPDDLPPVFGAVLRRCFEKNPKNRLRDVGDLRLALEGAFESSDAATPASRGRERLYGPAQVTQWVVAALVGGLLAVIVGTRVSEPVAPQVLRFEMSLPDDARFTSYGRRPLAISPGGTHIAAAADDVLWITPLDQGEWLEVGGTEGGSAPFFSPDGASVGFWADGQLKHVRISGGSPVTIGEAPYPPVGAHWRSDGTILYGLPRPGGGVTGDIWRVRASGGTAELVLTPDEGEGLLNPWSLPGDEHVLLTRIRPNGDRDVVVRSLTTDDETVVVEGGADARYASTGHLLYLVDDVLFGAPFDPNTRRVSGGAVSLVEGVASTGTRSHGSYALADSGSLTFVEDSIGDTATLAWVDRTGRVEPVPGDRLEYSDVRISNDGTRIAAHVRAPEDDVWTYDLTRGAWTRQTFAPGQNETPAWSPDDGWLAYTGIAGNAFSLLRLPVAGGRETERLWEAPGHFHIGDWTPDAKALVLDVQDAETQWDIWLFPIDDSDAARPLLESQFNERSGRVSPDGRWLAYASDESGRDEVYLRAFPDLGDRVTLSTTGGVQPVWSRDGSELYYRGPTDLMVVTLEGAPESIPAPAALFEDRFLRPQGSVTHTSFDVGSDGRFLMLDAGEAGTASIRVVANWLEDVKERVPVP